MYVSGQYYGNFKYHLVKVILFTLEGVNLVKMWLSINLETSYLILVRMLIANLTFVNMLPTLLEKHMEMLLIYEVVHIS